MERGSGKRKLKGNGEREREKQKGKWNGKGEMERENGTGKGKEEGMERRHGAGLGHRTGWDSVSFPGTFPAAPGPAAPSRGGVCVSRPEGRRVPASTGGSGSGFPRPCPVPQAGPGRFPKLY